jgi:heme-degrading monooxygenase HmoA
MVVILFELKKRPEADVPEYRAMLARMEEIVTAMPGYISSEDFVSEDGARDLSIVRFESLEALEAWRIHPEHLEAQRLARQIYFESYHIQVLTTVREYDFHQGEGRRDLYPVVPAAKLPGD